MASFMEERSPEPTPEPQQIVNFLRDMRGQMGDELEAIDARRGVLLEGLRLCSQVLDETTSASPMPERDYPRQGF